MAVWEHKFFSLHGQTVVTKGLQGFHAGLPACGMAMEKGKRELSA